MQHQDYNLLGEIKNFIESKYREERIGTITQEICDRFGISSSITYRYVSTLIDKGVLKKGKRGYEPVALAAAAERTKQIPFYENSIPCGPLTEIEGYIDEVFSLPESITGKGEFFLLRTKGDSMIDAGIDSGDVVLCRQQNTADIGQIVVALVDGSSTLKRLKRDNDGVYYLHPENTTMDDIYVDNIEIQGVVTKIIKNVK